MFFVNSRKDFSVLPLSFFPCYIYPRMGFTELECFPTLWDEHNPCQVYVMALDR